MKQKLQFFLLTICMIASFAGRSQTPVIDSLSALISKATSDTQLVNLINKKAYAFGEVNLDSALKLYSTNLATAIQIKYKKGEATSRLGLSRNLMFKGNYPGALNNLNAVKKIYAEINDSAGLASLNINLGMYYGMQSLYDSSIIYFKRSAAIAAAIKDQGMVITAFQNTATSYQMLSNFPQALTYFQKALGPAEATNDINSQSYIYLNLAITYSSLTDSATAERYFLKAIDYAEKAHIKNVELYAYSNLATLYGNKRRFKEAYNAAIKASVLGKETGDVGMEASSLSRAGLMLGNLKQYPEAVNLAVKGISIADSSKEPLNIFQTNCDYASILKMQDKFAEAIPFYEKAFSVMQSSDLYDNQVGQNYFDLSECYENTGNYQKALAAYKMSAQINDSISSKENIRKATELSLNYEFDKKQQLARAEQKRKDELAQARQIGLSVGLILTIALAAFAFYAFKNKKKANILLLVQKEEIQSTLSKLKTTQAQLIQSEKMASLGELTAGIAHEIQNPLNFVNNFSEVNKELLVDVKDEMQKGNYDDAKEIIEDVIGNSEKINHHGRRADAIVKGMLQHSQASTGRKEPVNINALCDEYLQLSYHGLRAKDKSFNAAFKTDFDESIGKVNIIPQDIGRVILNLINNAFYAVAEKKKTGIENYEPTVSVSTKKIGDMVQIKVGDNGNGIPQGILDKIFQPFFTTKPTGQGTGLGLSLSYDIVKAHGGDIRVESKEGEGTEFIFRMSAL